MKNPAYPYIKSAVEAAIPDLTLNLPEHLIISTKLINVLLHYDEELIKKAMLSIKRNFPKYHFDYECEVNAINITITRKSFYNLMS